MKRNLKILLTIALVTGIALASYVRLRKPNMPVRLPNLTRRAGEVSPSTEFLNAQRAVGYYRDEIRKNPGIVKNYIELAQIYLQEARVTAQERTYLPEAAYLLEEALERDPDNPDAMITQASLLATKHRFQQAKELAEKVIERNPYSAAAYAVLCDALVELGEYEQAVKACDQMLSIRHDIRSYPRASYLRELHGDLHGAREAMKLAADAGVFGHESRAWALYYLGKLFADEGKLDTAAYIFKGILDERPNYPYALSGLARINEAKGKTTEAIGLLEKAYTIMPEHLFLQELVELYFAMNQTEKAQSSIKKVLDGFEQDEREGWNVNREYAMFCANHKINLEDALTRAEKELRQRPKNINVLDTYAWTLYQFGKCEEALGFARQALRLGTKDATLYFHAASIAAGAGNKAEAAYYMAESQSINPYPRHTHSNEAGELLLDSRHTQISQVEPVHQSN